MAETSKIAWTDSTWNPWIGCTAVSPACDNCYAERSTPARVRNIVWGPGETREVTSDHNWNEPGRWDRKHEAFFAKHGRRRRVFCASLADVFDNEVHQTWRDKLWKVVRETPHLDWLILTKRIGNVPKMLPKDWNAGYRNVWLGISVVTQEEVDRDVRKLLAISARLRWLSMEPLLGPVDLTQVRQLGGEKFNAFEATQTRPRIDWVVVGGESGPKARPMHFDWANDVLEQCDSAGVPALFKQWGAWVPRSACYHTFADGTSASDLDPGAERWPSVRLTYRGHDGRRLENADDGGDDVYMQCVGVDMAGRLFQGRTIDGFPAAMEPA